MSINALNSYASTATLTDYLRGSEEEEKASGLRAARNSAAAAYGGNAWSGPGVEAMRQAVTDLQASGSGPVTFAMLEAYQAELEEEFTALMQAGLYMRGLEESEDFQLLATPEGQISVSSRDEALKKEVEAMLEENPKLVDQFLYIQALGNIERTRRLTPPALLNQEARAGLSAQAVDIFAQAAAGQGMGYSPLLGNYSAEEGAMQFLLGANLVV